MPMSWKLFLSLTSLPQTGPALSVHLVGLSMKHQPHGTFLPSLTGQLALRCQCPYLAIAFKWNALTHFLPTQTQPILLGIMQMHLGPHTSLFSPLSKVEQYWEQASCMSITVFNLGVESNGEQSLEAWTLTYETVRVKFMSAPKRVTLGNLLNV